MNVRVLVQDGVVYVSMNDLLLWLCRAKDQPNLNEDDRRAIRAVIGDLEVSRNEIERRIQE
jgi:hypothetical protein